MPTATICAARFFRSSVVNVGNMTNRRWGDAVAPAGNILQPGDQRVFAQGVS